MGTYVENTAEKMFPDNPIMSSNIQILITLITALYTQYKINCIAMHGIVV